jgi:hypothetical protein
MNGAPLEPSPGGSSLLCNAHGPKCGFFDLGSTAVERYRGGASSQKALP